MSSRVVSSLLEQKLCCQMYLLQCFNICHSYHLPKWSKRSIFTILAIMMTRDDWALRRSAKPTSHHSISRSTRCWMRSSDETLKRLQNSGMVSAVWVWCGQYYQAYEHNFVNILQHLIFSLMGQEGMPMVGYLAWRDILWINSCSENIPPESSLNLWCLSMIFRDRWLRVDQSDLWRTMYISGLLYHVKITYHNRTCSDDFFW